MLKSFSLSIFLIAAGSVTQAATITGLNATSLVIAAPATVTDAMPGSNEAVIAFVERSDVTLPEELAVLGGTLAAGTRVDSHMILLNRADAGLDVLEVAYGYAFGGQIAGVIGSAEDVAATHWLFGAQGTSYGPLHRLEGDDQFTVQGNRIAGFMRVMQPGDWFRVLTYTETSTGVLSSPPGGPAAVPVPSGGGFLAGALGLLAWRGARGNRRFWPGGLR